MFVILLLLLQKLFQSLQYRLPARLALAFLVVCHFLLNLYSVMAK